MIKFFSINNVDNFPWTQTLYQKVQQQHWELLVQ